MSASTQAFVGLVGALLLAVLIAALRRPTVPPLPPAVDKLPTGLKFDPNITDAATLQLLPGVGPGIAEHIVEAREGGREFGRVEDLEVVRFVGPSLVERVRPWVEFGNGSGER